MAVTVSVSWGELLDKITILKIKQQRIGDIVKRCHVERELAVLLEAWGKRQDGGRALDRLAEELRQVNETLWEVEDEIRRCEREADFGERFIELARSVYRTNDRRAALKYQINRLLDSDIIEEKSYATY